jgi:hypothetical protein
MLQQNTGGESNREPQIDPAIGFSAVRLSVRRSELPWKPLFVLFRHSKGGRSDAESPQVNA